MAREALIGSTSRQHQQFTPSLRLSLSTLRRHLLFLSWNTLRQHPQFLSWDYIAPAPAVPVVEYIAPAPAVPVGEYIAPAPAVPVVEYIAPAPAAPVMEYIAPAQAVFVMKYIAPAPAVPVVEYIAPAPAVYAAPAPVMEDIASAFVSPPTPVVEYIASVPTSTPAVSSPPATCVQSRQSAHRVSTEVPTVSSRHHHDEMFRAERVLRARAARHGYLFRQMKRRDTQLAAQLTSLGKACEVARGSPVASLLVPVAMREQGFVFQVAGL